MRKFFTLQRAAIRIALFGLIIFGSINANSQCTTALNEACNIQVTEDFNGSTGGFTSSTFTFTGTNFQKSVTRNTTGHTITSREFQVGSNTNTAQVGFTIGGDARPRSYLLEVLSPSNQILASCTIALQGTGNSTGSKCVTINTEAYKGQLVKFRISFSIQDNQQGGGIITFDDFRTNLSEQGTLPVNFISFDAKAEGNSTQLTWKVADQIDVLRYDVERSLDGNNFSKIGEVEATDVTTYNFTDRQPAQGTVYYRVKNVDIDGKFKYSTIVSLRNGASAIVLKAFPLPAKNNVTLQHGSAGAKTAIRISAHDGRQVAAIRPAGGSMQTSIDLSAYAPGLYLISFDNGNGQVETLKVVKQ